MAGVTQTPIQSSIPVDLKKRIREMQHSTHTGPPGDLEDNKKRWLVVGICLHSILSPSLRTFISQVVNNLYNALKISDLIDIQTHPSYLRKYGVANFELNYETINNNKSTYGYQRALYDYTVQNGVDLSKLFLQTHMAHYTAFDESCDSSALLGLIVNIDKFPVNVQTAARDVRSAVRNSWAHCNFTEWDTMKFNSSLQQIEDFIYLLKLNGPDESQIIGELNKWRTNGSSFFQGTTIGLELVDDIQQQIQVLVEYAEVICKSGDTEFLRVHTELKEMGKMLSQSDKRILTLENTIATHGRALATQGQILATQEQTLLEYTCLYDSDLPEIERWREKNKDFIITDIVTDIIEILEEKHCVLLTGISGTGKTVTAQNIALHLFHRNGYRLIPCNNVKDIKKRFKDNVTQVFVVDDICGKYTANIKYIEDWMKVKEFVTYILDKGKTKILATCRTEIFKEKSVKLAIKFFQKPYDLTINYSTADKIKIARTYLKGDDKIFTDIVRKYEFSPLMCFLYSKHDDFDVSEFLSGPYKTFSDEWDTLKTFDKEKFCVLLLCVIYNGTINADLFEFTNDLDKEENSKLKVIFECCNLGRDTSRFAIKDKLNACVDTYFIKVDREYKVIHDKMFDFLCFYFGKTLLTPILKFANVKLISERVQLRSIQKANCGFTILISLKDEQQYIDRLIMDLQNGNIHSCLNNTQMKYKEYRTKFIDVVKKLNIELKKDLTKTEDDNGITAFIISCLRGYEDIVECFISIGADPDMLIGFFTPLTAACRDGHIKTVEVLLKNGASKNKTNSYGETGLFCACCCGHYDLVKYLLGKGVDINKQNKFNRTSLYVSCLAGYESIANKLIAEGANYVDLSNSLIGATLGGHANIIKILIANDCDVNFVDLEGRTALCIASEEGNAKIEKLLTEENADNFKVENAIMQQLLANVGDINIINRNGQILADLANRECKGVDDIKLDSFEDKDLRSADIEKDQMKKSQKQKIDNTNNVLKFGSTPLYEACARGDIENVKELIKNRAIVNMKTDSGKLPLVAACQQGYHILIQMLLDNGADTHQALLCAVQQDCGRAVTFLLDKNSDTCYEEHNGQPLIAIACEHGSIEAIGILLEKDLHVEKCNEEGNTLVHAACMDNNFEEFMLYHSCRLGLTKQVKSLLKNQVYISKKYKYVYTPLILADIGGHDTLSEYLPRQECNQNGTKYTIRVYKSRLYNNMKTYNRLFNACMYGDEQKLLKKNMLVRMNLNIFFNPTETSGTFWFAQTPLCLAIRSGQKELVALLLEYDSMVNLTYENMSENDTCSSCYTTFSNGYTPLFAACQRKYFDIVDLLLKKGANLSKALYDACREGYLDTVQFLVKKGANVNAYARYGQTVMYAACFGGNYPIVKFLVEQGAIIQRGVRQIEHIENLSCLHVACIGGNHHIVQLLIDGGLSVNTISNLWRPVLHTACTEGNYTIVKMLIDNDVDTNVYNANGCTALMTCVFNPEYHSNTNFSYNSIFEDDEDIPFDNYNSHLFHHPEHKLLTDKHYKIIQLLIEKGTNIDQLDLQDRSVVFYASKIGEIKLVKILLSIGADINLRTNNGDTPISIARMNNHVSVLNVLKKREHGEPIFRSCTLL